MFPWKTGKMTFDLKLLLQNENSAIDQRQTLGIHNSLNMRNSYLETFQTSFFVFLNLSIFQSFSSSFSLFFSISLSYSLCHTLLFLSLFCSRYFPLPIFLFHPLFDAVWHHLFQFVHELKIQFYLKQKQYLLWKENVFHLKFIISNLLHKLKQKKKEKIKIKQQS